MEAVTKKALDFLVNAEMITDLAGRLSATEYGNLVSLLYIDPRGAETIVSGMSSAVKYSDTGLLHLICSTPDMFCLYVSNRDLPLLERYLIENEDELWLTLGFGEEETFFRALKTALVLRDWSREVPLETICERYFIGPGDVYALVESCNWLLHASGRLSSLYAPRFTRAIREFEICMKHGVKRELLPLIRLRNIGRVRARSLFSNGITSPEAIRRADPRVLASILGRGVAQSVLQQLEQEGSGDSDNPEGDKDDDEDGLRGQSRLDAFHRVI